MGNFRRFGAVLIHAAPLVHYSYIRYYTSTYLKLPEDGPFIIFRSHGGHFKFLTIWNVIFQAFFFWLCIINDLFGTNEVNPVSKPFLRKLRDFLHASIGVPLSLLIVVLFWSLWNIDRELVFPTQLDVYFPSWLNHSMHTTIGIYTILHTIFCYNEYPSRKAGLAALFTVVALYVSIIFAIYCFDGIWVYPIFNALNWPLKIFFVSIVVSFAVVLYFLGEFFNNLIWSSQIKGNQRHKTKTS